MRLKTSIIALATGILLFAACKKTEKDPDPTPPATKSKHELISDGKWQYSALSFILKVNGKDTTMDAWSVLEDCRKDDFSTYSTNGTGTIDEGPTKCDPADPQTKSLTWEFQDNETYVKVTDNNGPTRMKIIELTATQAKFETRTLIGADSATVVSTFKNIK